MVAPDELEVQQGDNSNSDSRSRASEGAESHGDAQLEDQVNEHRQQEERKEQLQVNEVQHPVLSEIESRPARSDSAALASPPIFHVGIEVDAAQIHDGNVSQPKEPRGSLLQAEKEEKANNRQARREARREEAKRNAADGWEADWESESDSGSASPSILPPPGGLAIPPSSSPGVLAVVRPRAHSANNIVLRPPSPPILPAPNPAYLDFYPAWGAVRSIPQSQRQAVPLDHVNPAAPAIAVSDIRCPWILCRAPCHKRKHASNLITCAACSAKFCYLCHSNVWPFDGDWHYHEWNLLGCPDMEYADWFAYSRAGCMRTCMKLCCAIPFALMFVIGFVLAFAAAIASIAVWLVWLFGLSPVWILWRIVICIYETNGDGEDWQGTFDRVVFWGQYIPYFFVIMICGHDS